MKQVILHFTTGREEIVVSESTEILGLWVGEKSEKIDLNLNLKLNKPNLTCRLYLKLILFADSQVKLNTNFQIAEKAVQSDSYLKIAALLCSPDCQLEITPGLEIEANNLKAGHALAVSNLDPEELFYLQAKGLSKITAEKVLIQAFAGDIIERATTPESKKELELAYAKLERVNQVD